MAGRRLRQQLAEVHSTEGDTEHRVEVGDDGRLHVFQLDRVPEELLHGRHDATVVPARPDLEELPQVRRHVVGKSVERHVPMDREPDRRDLLAADPDAALGALPRRVDPEVRTRSEEDLLEVRHEPLHLEPVRELQDWIADELAGPVIRRLAAPFDLEDLEPGVEDVLTRPASAQRRDRIVLDEDQAIRDLVLRPTIDEGLLELPHLPIRLAAAGPEPRVPDAWDRRWLPSRR